MFISRWATDISTNARNAPRKMSRSEQSQEFVLYVVKTFCLGLQKSNEEVVLLALVNAITNVFDKYWPRNTNIKPITLLFINGCKNIWEKPISVSYAVLRTINTTIGLIRVASIGRTLRIGGNSAQSVTMLTTISLKSHGLLGRNAMQTALSLEVF